MKVLDTHAWLWWCADIAKIPARLRGELAKERELVVSTISAWEVAMLVAKGRLGLRGDTRSAIRALMAAPRIRMAPVTEAVALEAGLFASTFHGDPADRIIVATALDLRATLVTKDRLISSAGLITTEWN
jgi:PIN domain nuclease of toxin-antitoxin system